LKRYPYWNANTHYHDVILASLPRDANRVLDVGCGDGILLADLIKAGVQQVVGLDSDRTVLERARARHHDLPIEWLHGDEHHPALAPETFDGSCRSPRCITCMPHERCHALRSWFDRAEPWP
jgi:SAM-dependent methyltransferase